MTQFKDKSPREGGRPRVGGAVHLPDPAGRRHPALPGRPGAGRRGPAPAPRADPRPGAAVQRRFGDTFVVPEPYIVKETAKILDLQNPDKQMSKSIGGPGRARGCSTTRRSPRRRSGRRSPTPGARSASTRRASPASRNLLTILSALGGGAGRRRSRSGSTAAGYGDLKAEVAEVVVAFVTPFRERVARLPRRPGRLDEALRDRCGQGARRRGADARDGLRPGRLPAGGAVSRVHRRLDRAQRRAVLGVAIAIPEPYGTELPRSASGSATRWPRRSRRTSRCCRPRPSTTCLLPEIDQHLAAAAAETDPFEIQLRGTGTFRPVSPVVFVAVARGHRRLRAARDAGAVRRAVAAGAVPLPPARDRRPRPAGRTSSTGALEELADYAADFTVDGFILYEHVDGVWVPDREFAFAGG